MSFDTLNAEVDLQVLSLRPHSFRHFPWWAGNRWLWTFACVECGRKYEGWYHAEQICLGVLGELMLAGEKVPARWTHNFADRVRVAKRVRKKKQSLNFP